MCGRYALDLDTSELKQLVNASPTRPDFWTPRWNIAPTSDIPIVIATMTAEKTVRRILGPARWSLTPPWSQTLETSYPTFNARSESAATKPTFRQALAHTRALIPASGYFEWHSVGRVKTPHYIHHPSGTPLVFAGLYSVWSSGGQQAVTATILTRPAPPSLEWIHSRSPVVLPADSWDSWLDPRVRGTQEFLDQAVAASDGPSGELTQYEVLPIRHDSPEIIQPRRGDEKASTAS